MTDARLRNAEVRLGRAQEFYSHTRRVGSDDEVSAASAEVDRARRELAALRPLNDEDAMRLDDGVAKLRERLARPSATQESQPSESANAASGTEITAAVAGSQTYTDTDVENLAIDVPAGIAGEAAVASVHWGRRVISGNHASLLEQLGERFAEDLLRIDSALAEIQADLHVRGGWRSATDRPTVPALLLGPLAVPVTLLIVSVMAAAQIEIASDAFSVASSSTAITLAAGYVTTLAATAFLAGLRAAAMTLRSTDSRVVVVAGLIVMTTLVVAILAATNVQGPDGTGSSVSAVAAYTLFACAFAGVIAAIGVAVARRGQQAQAANEAAADTRRLYAALEQERIGLLRRYLARGEEIRAEHDRLDALYVRSAVLRVDHVVSEPLADSSLAIPEWMGFAEQELSHMYGAASAGAPLRWAVDEEAAAPSLGSWGS